MDSLSTKQQTTAHVDINNYVTSAAMYVTSARTSMDFHRRDEQEGNLARYLNPKIYKLYVIN